ncbi:hypothetical protein [Massilia sp. 9096]|uniref:hypothetical protein n=1 Tax=Massilia sp. 9096 TaxID=1500894 RepID=UPI000AE973FE|nr:hypothetical protein [Massilia sp. 9096]
MNENAAGTVAGVALPGKRPGRLPRVARAIYTLALLGATFNHARIVLAHGLGWDYGGVPSFVSGFWTALTFLDPLAVLLLWLALRAGLAASAAIIVADVAINAWVGLAYGFDWPAFSAQCLFLVFVACTLGPMWRHGNSRKIR